MQDGASCLLVRPVSSGNDVDGLRGFGSRHFECHSQIVAYLMGTAPACQGSSQSIERYFLIYFPESLLATLSSINIVVNKQLVGEEI